MDKSIIKLLSKLSQEEIEIKKSKGINSSIYSFEHDNIVKIKSLIGDNIIGIRTHTRFASFPSHKHDYLEIIYVCKGHITHHLDSQVLLLNEGNLLIMNKNVFHNIEKTSQDDIGINFLISDDFLVQIITNLNQNSFLTEFLIRSLDKNNTDKEFLLYQVGDCIPIQNILSNLCYSLSGDHHNSPSIIPDNFSLLLNYLVLYDEAIKLSFLSINKKDMLLNYIEDYLNENYKIASLKELSKLTHYSESYLSRYIKKNFKEGFLTLLEKKRVQVASTLLITSDYSIQDIIEFVGYNNRTHFIHLFKKEFHYSPSQYRTKYKNKIINNISINYKKFKFI